MGLRAFDCPGRPEPDSPRGRAWEIIYGEVIDHLHGDASGLDEGVAGALDKLADAGLLRIGARGGPTPEALLEAVRAEQGRLWDDLRLRIYQDEYTLASGGVRSLVERIIALARLVGATYWGQVNVRLLLDGYYEYILGQAGIAYQAVDWAAVAACHARNVGIGEVRIRPARLQ